MSSPLRLLLSLLFTMVTLCGSLTLAQENVANGATSEGGSSGTVFELTLRQRTARGDGSVQIQYVSQAWDPSVTAIIVCDMWDAHHCLNAVRRAQQLAPRIDALLKQARERGVTIIHAPSSCMEFYKDHAARKRAQEVPKATTVPEEIGSWCHWKNATEEEAGYPIDASDGGEDDDPEEHRRWAERLKQRGRNPGSPWVRQIDTITIDEQRDYITDNGVENWSILAHQGIEHVLLVGVHTNMCVLGRPFGLRQLANNGMQVALVRDLTDTMYNPKMPPFVSHFSGTDLIVEHIERYVCPTISSEQVLGGEPFKFRGDRRPHVVLMIGEQEYQTEKTLPQFAHDHLYQSYRVSYVTADGTSNDFHNIQAIADADLLFVSVRRRLLKPSALKFVRDYIDSGRPLVGIRTASHAFAPREGDPPSGRAAYREFDTEVWGGNYQGHHNNKLDDDLKTMTWLNKDAASSPLLRGVKWSGEQQVRSWLYKTSPLAAGTGILMMGRVGDRKPHEPVAWTNIHSGGGRAFYTSLGHPDDFANPNFQQLLKNAVAWSLESR